MKKYLAVIILFLLMSVGCNSGIGPVTPEPPSREWLMKQVEIFLVEWGYPTPIHPGTDMSPDGLKMEMYFLMYMKILMNGLKRKKKIWKVLMMKKIPKNI